MKSTGVFFNVKNMGQWYQNASANERESFENAIRGLNSGLNAQPDQFISLSTIALAAGPTGTNYSFTVDTSTNTNPLTGVKIVGNASGSGVAVAAIANGSSNENLTLNALGTGTLSLNNTATGIITLGQRANSAQSTGVAISASTSGATAAITATAQGLGNGLLVIGGASATDALLGSALSVKYAANVAGATVAPFNVVASTASQAVLSISGVFISTASINLAANKTAFIVPVYHETQKVWGYLAASIGVS